MLLYLENIIHSSKDLHLIIYKCPPTGKHIKFKEPNNTDNEYSRK